LHSASPVLADVQVKLHTYLCNRCTGLTLSSSRFYDKQR